MSRLWPSLRSALEHRAVQAFLACALLVPVVATAGQYSASGFWTQPVRVDLLYWPGQPWKWGLTVPVWLSMGTMLTSYIAGIGWLVRRRSLSSVVLSGLGAIVIANLLAKGINGVIGWKDLQTVSTMDLTGRANRAIFSLWHNPAWEELVFRGVPLSLLLLVRRRVGDAPRWPLWGFYVLPSFAFAAYHVPGHGPARLADTFILGLAFAWMAVAFTFLAPLVLHYLFDAMMTLSLGGLPNIPRAEVAWLVEYKVTLNSTWSTLLLLWVLSVVIVFLVRQLRTTRDTVAVPIRPSSSQG